MSRQNKTTENDWKGGHCFEEPNSTRLLIKWGGRDNGSDILSNKNNEKQMAANTRSGRTGGDGEMESTC